MNELVKVEGVTKRFKGRHVLDDVSFSVRSASSWAWWAQTGTRSPAFANIDPPRMFQLQARFIF